MARERWTDERIDDLKEGMNERFDQVDKRFDQVDKHFDRVEGQIEELRGDIKGMQRLMVQGFVAFCTVMVSGFFALAGLTAF